MRTKQKTTQSYRLYQRLLKKGAASTVELSKVIGRPPAQTPGYVMELVRVFGAKIVYDTNTKQYKLVKRDPGLVPKTGAAGQRLGHSLKKPHIAHVKVRGTRGRPAASAQESA